MSAPERITTYENAFFEAALERWAGALDEMAGKLARDGALAESLQAANVEFGQRRQLLDPLLPDDVDLPVRNLFYTLMERGDLRLLAGIADALRQRARQAEGRQLPVEVVSAVPLTDDERQKLVARLKAQFGAGLNIGYRVDQSILGGLIVHAGDRLIDGSVAARLAALRQSLGVSTGSQDGSLTA